MNPLYSYLKSTIGFASKEIELAFADVDRADFVPQQHQQEAYVDYPLPIGYGVTISQPTTVAFMINQLDPKLGDKVLDVGAGSGWTTALLAYIVGRNGEVTGTEIIKQLVAFGNQNIKKYRFKNAKIILADKQLGLSQEAPFDRILVSAAAEKLPGELLEQLAIGGKMVIPIQTSIWKIDRVSQDQYNQQEFPGFMFVPLR